MAIVGNIATEIGDVIVIEANTPVVGLIALTSFMDTVTGESGSRFFTKIFRYSLDGIHFSDWQDLTIPNLMAINIVATDTFISHYRYTRAGADPSGTLSFENITLDGDSVATVCGDAYDNSVFSEFFDCLDVECLNWAINVLQKLYDQGIIPKYINRNVTGGLMEDLDFVEFWRSVTIFFSYLVCLARTFETFSQNARLAEEYLRQKDFQVCGNEILNQLLFLITNLLREKGKRGTTRMYREVVVSGEEVDGELLRLVCRDDCTEFLLGVAKSQNIGWNLGNSSPMYKGSTPSDHLIKGYEFQEDILDFTLYPIVGNPVGWDVELIVNGTFDIDLSGWTTTAAGIAFAEQVAGGQARLVTPAGDALDITQSAPNFNSGIDYLVQTDVNVITGAFEIQNDGDSANIFSTPVDITDNGFNVVKFTPGANGALRISSLATTISEGFFDNVSVLLYGPTHPAVDGTRRVLEINEVGAGNEAGIGDQAAITKTICVDPNINYEITFFVRQVNLEPTLTFGLFAFDEFGNNATVDSVVTGTPDTTFFERFQLNLNDQYYFVRGILYNQNQVNLSAQDAELNIGTGNQLRMGSNVAQIIPKVTLDNTLGGGVSGTTRIHDFKIKPILPYSNAFLNNGRWIDVLLKNKNGQLTNDQIDMIMRDDFIPYNTSFKNTFL